MLDLNCIRDSLSANDIHDCTEVAIVYYGGDNIPCMDHITASYAQVFCLE